MGSAVSCRSGRRTRTLSFLGSAPPESCLDLNTATEEELMTLPRVTRAVAQSITAHRRKIHGFRRVEDLALVTGVGAELMLELRPEIQVGKSAPTGGESEGQSDGASAETLSERREET